MYSPLSRANPPNAFSTLHTATIANTANTANTNNTRDHHYEDTATSASSTSESDSESDSDVVDGAPHGPPPRRTQATTLGQMLPHHIHTVSPIYNSTQCRTVVLQSRDRDMFHEHLFRFSVGFGDVSRFDRTDARIGRERRALCYPDGTNPHSSHPLPSSVSLALATDKACPAQESCGNANGANCGGAAVLSRKRQCVIEQPLRDVVSVRLPHLVMPKYAHMTSMVTEYDAGTFTPTVVVPLKLPPNVTVELQPVAPQQQLLGTNATLGRSTFFCTATDDSDSWMHMRGTGCTTVQDTPLHYTTPMSLTLHTPDGPLHRTDTAHNPAHSPDVMCVQQIGFAPAVGSPAWTPPTLQFVLEPPLPSHIRVDPGCVVSVRDVWVAGADGVAGLLAGSPERLLYEWLCVHAPDGQFAVVSADRSDTGTEIRTTSLTVSLARYGSSSHTILPTVATLLTTEPTRTCVLNESMQYTVVLEFTSEVRRLRRVVGS